MSEPSNLFKILAMPVDPSETIYNEKQKNQYRFGGDRYSLRGTASYGPSDIIGQVTGLYTFPRGEEEFLLDPDISSSTED